MGIQLDHVVVWVDDPVASARFYRQVVGLEPLRLDEFTAGRAPFVSVRVTPQTIIDLTPRSLAATLNAVPGAAGTAGHLVNHICLAMDETEFDALRRRLEAGGHRVTPDQVDSYGARGIAPRVYYFSDPDGNVLEARYYPADQG